MANESGSTIRKRRRVRRHCKHSSCDRFVRRTQRRMAKSNRQHIQRAAKLDRSRLDGKVQSYKESRPTSLSSVQRNYGPRSKLPALPIQKEEQAMRCCQRTNPPTASGPQREGSRGLEDRNGNAGHRGRRSTLQAIPDKKCPSEWSRKMVRRNESDSKDRRHWEAPTR